MRTWHLKVVAVLAVVGAFAVTIAAQQRAESRDMTLLGSDDLQARSAYQPIIQKQGDRYIAYIGHHAGSMPNVLTGKLEDNGTSVVDVTNPRQPKFIAHIPGGGEAPGPGQAQMVRACTGLPKGDRNKVYLLRTLGTSGHEVWDVTTPEKPSRVSLVVSGLKDTHKSFWECETGIAYLVGGDPAWRTLRMTKIYDLSDPAHPVFIRDFGLPGQQPGSTMMPVPTEVHGPISMPKLNRVYFGYGTGRYGVVQIVDRKKLLEGPKEPTEANLRYPVIGQLDMPIDAGAHTVFPLLHMALPEFSKQIIQPVVTSTAAATHDARTDGYTAPTTQGARDFIVAIGETTANECTEPRQLVRMIDATFENTDRPTKTETEKAFAAGFTSMWGNVAGLVRDIGLAAVFTIIMVAANTMAMSIRERVNEVAVLKTLGFRPGTLLTLLTGESLAIALLGCLLGAGGAKLLFDAIDLSMFIPFISVFKVSWRTLGICFGVASLVGAVSGFIPAWRAARVDIVEGLRKVA